MTGLLHFLIAIVLLGDYLMLSASRVFLGANQNWLLFTGIAQVVALVLAVLLGRGRSLHMSIPMLGFIGLGVVMLAHTANRAIEVGTLDDYGTTKTLTYFAISGPAFLLGCIIGQYQKLPGSRCFPWLIAPLLLMCAIAATTDPGIMTVRRAEDLAVFFGVLVLPVHQALAFSLGKISLWLHTTAQHPDRRWPGRLVLLGLIGLCVGMSILSGSRGYLLAAAFALAVQWWIGRRRLGLAVLGIGVPIAVFMSLSSDVVRDGLDPTVVLGSYSMQERLALFRAAIDAFWECPLFGHGPGGFSLYYGWDERVYPHNIFLEILSEFGLAGFTCFLMILIPITVRALRVAARGGLTDVQFFALGFLAFSIVGAMGVADLIRNHFLFLAAGMTAVACAPTTEEAPRPGLAGKPATAT